MRKKEIMDSGNRKVRCSVFADVMIFFTMKLSSKACRNDKQEIIFRKWFQRDQKAHAEDRKNRQCEARSLSFTLNKTQFKRKQKH